MMLYKGCSGSDVLKLQQRLIELGYQLVPDGDFGSGTDAAVKLFQHSAGLSVDGWVGDNTWNALFPATQQHPLIQTSEYEYTVPMVDLPLRSQEYYQQYGEVNFGKYGRWDAPRKQIVLHHTAGSGSAKATRDWWNMDNNPVATTFVIDASGMVYRMFNEMCWAWHLGISTPTSAIVNAGAIGIEICNWGFLNKVGNRFYSYANVEVPESEVCVLEKPFRGMRYFQKYTPAQIQSAIGLVKDLSRNFGIIIPQNDYSQSSSYWNVDQQAIAGKMGLYTHCNYLDQKIDIYPQPEMVAALETLN